MSDGTEQTDNQPSFVVGIGASAGGLESLEQLFRNMSTASDMAFVVIQHLSPDFKSMMSELLARDTSMRIAVAEDGMRVQPNVIYLMPAKKEMLIADGCLHLSEKDTNSGFSLPIDHFFESLARELGDKAIAVVLSGSGTDGTRGVAEVARHGGLVVSESLESAKFDGMPSSAQATGLVDLVLPPDEIGSALLRFCDDPASIQRERFDRDEQAASLKGIDAIFQLFRTVYDIDFASYKDTTIMRRIRRRLAMLQLKTFDQYADLLQSDSTELHSLYGDLLIGVTEFFRDGEVFDSLINNVLPQVVQRRDGDQPIRAWVAGCATGEEAYSITIALKEAMRAENIDRPLKVFATDIHKRSVETASRGYFPAELMETMPDKYANRYFESRNGGFQIKPEIRKAIVFSPHNILRDAPFTDLDFVSCRNMLIYLRPTAQRRAISLFHYGLRTGGVLLLGSSESTGELSSEFDVIEERQRIYRKSRDVRLTQNLRSPLAASETVHRNIVPQQRAAPPRPGAGRTRQVHDELLERFMPPSILIDGARTVIDTFAGAEDLLKFPSRQPTLDILDLVGRDVRTTLSGAINRSIKKQATVRYGKVKLQRRGNDEMFNLTVEPVGGKVEDRCYLVTFSVIETEPAPVSQTDEQPTAASTEHDRVHIRQLEDDLRYSRENLQNTVEELESSNEELQTTNEELIASNEELQSTNEELHSLNEELYSVNSEHQRKIEQLAELNRDMNHLLENTGVATVFLDAELRIRRYTSRVQAIFDLIEEDIGRSIGVFGAKLRIVDLMQRLNQVLETGEVYEREVRGPDTVTYLMRLLPYQAEDTVEGVVMMWIDISSLEQLRGKLRWASAIVDSTSDAIIGQDLDGAVVSWNQGAEYLYGYKAEEVIGQSMDILVPSSKREEVIAYRERIMEQETVVSADTQRLHKNGELIDVSLTVSPVANPGGEVIGISKIARDIGPRLAMQREIRQQVQQRERFLAMLSHELRNPVNAVSSAASVLASDNANTVERDLSTATIQRQVTIVKRLLGDLLDVARIAENRIDLEFETLDLRDLKPLVEEIVQTSLDQHRCTVLFDLPSEPVYIQGDRTRLIQVQVNLIHNAAKYSGTPTPIRVGVRNENGKAHLWVADDGCGIPPSQLESIFEPFAQLDESRANSDGGLGVGLTLAKSLIELHNGTISAESAGEGQGAVFHIWLPALVAEDVKKEDAAAAEATNQSLQAESGPMRFCLVEDLEDSRLMMKTLLEIFGHNVSTAENGALGIEVICDGEFDVAMVDIGLPDMSGYEVVAKVREQAGGKLPYLVALTGYGQPGDIKQAKSAGFDQHVIKPIEPGAIEQICEAVKRKES